MEKTWHQNVFVLSNDSTLRDKITAAFGDETSLYLASDGDEAMQTLSLHQFKVFIIDDQCLPEYKENWTPDVGILDLCNEAHKNHDRPKIMILSNRIHKYPTDFLERSRATLLMNREHISMTRVIHLIRILRNRTYRTVLSRDFIKAKTFKCPLFCYIPENDEYKEFIKANEAITPEHIKLLINDHAYHLYVRENELHFFIDSFPDDVAKNLYSTKLNNLRKNYRDFLMDFSDGTKVGKEEEGKRTLAKGKAVIVELQNLINSFEDMEVCIKQLPYPRMSELAHGLNTALYVLIFGKYVEMKADSHEVALAALIHNIGNMEIDQRIIMSDRSKLSKEDLEIYKSHVHHSVKIAKKHPPFDSELFKNVLLHHHENCDGSGYPDGIKESKIPEEAALVAIASTYDYLKTLKPNQGVTPPKEAYKMLMNIQGKSKKKYSHSMLTKIAPVFNLIT